MNFGRQEDADEQRRRPRDEDLAHAGTHLAPARACRPRATTSRPTPREALTSTVSPGRSSSRGERGRVGGVGDGVRLAAEAPRPCAPRSGPTVDEQVDPARARRGRRSPRGSGPRRARARACRRARRRGARRGRGEIVEGGAHRHRVGVVAVVDDDDRPGQLDPLAAQGAQRDLERAARLDADRPRGGQRGERVAAHVRRAERQRQPSPSSATSPPGPNVTTRRSSRRCGASSGSPAGTTAVAARAQAGDQLGLRRGDRLDRPEQLEVDRADVDDDADVGLGDRRQLGDLARRRASPSRARAPRCRRARRGSSAAARSRC